MAAAAAAAGEASSLKICGLLPWMDKDYLRACFSRSPELASLVVKAEGFGFLNFTDHVAADQILRSYNGQDMPNSRSHFDLRWVAPPPPPPPPPHGDGERTLYAGNLGFDVTEFMLHHVFKARYPSVKGAKLVWDRDTARSKGYGFVLFGDCNEYTQALTEMNGAFCSTRPMRVGPALNNRIFSYGKEGIQSDCDPYNSKLFVGGLDPSVTDEDLIEAFSPYGEVVNVKLIVGKNCGFVTYSSRASAQEAIRMLNGSQLGGLTIKVLWGQRPSNKQKYEQDQWNGGHSG